jgi:serine/threonine protein kinase/tetratricopeptide (TPR) repeat protein
MAVEKAASTNRELDQFIEAYESVQARGDRADLEEFLPAREHYLYPRVLRELVRVDLEYGWRRGQPQDLSDYQSRFPDLFQDPESLQAIAFEEYRLRRQLGVNPSPDDYQKRWGVAIEHWPLAKSGTELGTSRKTVVHRAVSLRPPASIRLLAGVSPLPSVGSEFLDFELLADLGQGSFGRVYLAKQKGLAGRHVVLKISASYNVEVDNLAQVQHTNIIPIYSIHRSGPLQAICMPYLGSVTLADVLTSVRGQRAIPQSGKALVDTAQACKSTTRHYLESLGSTNHDHDAEFPYELREAPPIAWKQMEALSYVQAVVWMISRLADGLAHAHERGILHRDLKPANVLLTDDGQPMLLDFNLSEDTKDLSGASTGAIGGTLPYMAPEHLQAFQKRVASADPRSDIFSLGVILYELLTGRQPFPVRTGAIDKVLAEMIEDRRKVPQLRKWNKAVSPAIESIVRHCLESRPDERYQSARQLQEDIERQLSHRPLRHAPERSWREQFVKAFRRNPRFVVTAGAAAGMLLIAGLLTVLGLWKTQLARWEATSLCAQYRDEIQKARIMIVTSRPADREQVEEGMAEGYKALDRFEVRTNPTWWNAPPFTKLSAALQQQLREETSEFLFHLASAARAQADSSDTSRRSERIRDALELNRLAESCCLDERVPLTIRRQRDDLNQLLDPRAKRGSTPSVVERTSVSTTRDLCLLAQELMDKRKFSEAGELWRQASRQDPKVLWSWAGLAAYYENLERYDQAAACYSTCIALVPRYTWWYFKRGTAYLRTKDFSAAHTDLDQYLADQPDVADGYISRALAFQGLKQDKQAVDDLSKAIELGTPRTQVYFIRAVSFDRIGDAAAAAKDRAKGLSLIPTDEVSWVLRGLQRIGNDPKGAVADFDEALRLNPRSFDGLQNKASVLSENLGRIEEAVEVLNKEIELYPDSVQARAGRGVLLGRLGRRTEAIKDAEECLRRDIQPEVLYQVAGIYALTSRQRAQDRRQAFLLLACAFDKGYGLDLIGRDADLNPIRDDPEFRRLVAEAKYPK